MKQYLDALAKVMMEGEDVETRNGKVRKLFGHQMRFDLTKTFPAMTTKKLAWKSVVAELLWFLEGSTDDMRLREILYGKEEENLEQKRTIWTDNLEAYEGEHPTDLGRIYGAQWRKWKSTPRVFPVHETDQIANLIEGLKKDPHSRRHMLVAWNAGEIDQGDRMALPPCHVLAQFFISKDKLCCQLYQRSCDMFLGVPFNIASYSLLTHIIAKEVGIEAGEFIHTLGDYHVYHDHFDAVHTQLSRKPGKLPTLNFEYKPIDKYTVEDFTLVDYEPQGVIKAKMNV